MQPVSERTRPFRTFLKPWCLCLVALSLVSLQRLTAGVEQAAAGTNRPPRLSVATLPFNNVSSKPELDQWRRGLARIILGPLNQGQRLDLVGWAESGPALTNAGWPKKVSVDAGMAGRVARELELDAVIWGNYTRQQSNWVVEVHLVRLPDTNEVIKEFRAPSLNELRDAVVLAMNEQLKAGIPKDAAKSWRKMGGSDTAWSGFVRALQLEQDGAGVAAREKAWRAILKSEPGFLPARMELIQLLLRNGKRSKARPEADLALEQAPDLCNSHCLQAGLSLRELPLSRQSVKDKLRAEQHLREALRVHPGCPSACQQLYFLWHGSEHWRECRPLLEQAYQGLPEEPAVAAFLASARQASGDSEGAAKLVRDYGDAGRAEVLTHEAFIQTAFETGCFPEGLRDVRRLQQQSVTDTNMLQLLSSIDLKLTNPMHEPPRAPRPYRPDQLKAELEGRLTAEERALAVNPVEITPEIVSLAEKLSRGITNQGLRALLLFDEVVQRGRGTGIGGMRTAAEALQSGQEPETRFSCQEHAKLFVALARAAGLQANLVHVDILADGTVALHDCAALFLDGQGFLVDPALRAFGIEHRQFRVLDDLQAMAHQAMQPADHPNPARVHLGRKLDPDDPWTRLKAVVGLANAGRVEEAEIELRAAAPTCTNRWDYYEAAGVLAGARERWDSAVAALNQALSLSPSNAMVHLRLAQAYLQLHQVENSRQHSEILARLDSAQALAAQSPNIRFALDMVGALVQAGSEAPANRQELEARAQAGDAAAQYALSKMLVEADPPDTKQALAWLRKAAEQGNPEIQRVYANNVLAVHKEAGAQEALLWYTRSAEQGDEESQYELGKLLYEGKLFPMDEVAGCQWVMLAAETGHKQAQTLLNEMKLMMDQGKLAEARVRVAAFKAKGQQQGS